MKFNPEEILFSPTARCNLDCPHCDTPKSNKDLSKTPARKFLIDSKALGIKRIGFTGGEPFLATGFLCSLVRIAIKEGMIFDRIMTNAVWYKNKSELMDRLTKLWQAGYDGDICASVDAFHRQDLRKVAGFIRAAQKIWRRPDIVSIAAVFGSKDAATKEKLAKLKRLLEGRFIRVLKIGLSPVGKAAKFKEPWDGKWFKEDFCRGIGNVFFVLPNGDVKPCCGYATDLEALTIGNIRRSEPRDIVKNAGKNRFVSAVFGKGLAYVRKRLENAGVGFPGKTTNHCYFCHYILTNIPGDTLNKCLP